MLTAAHGQEALSLPANVPLPGNPVTAAPAGVRFVTPPPPGFDALTASPSIKHIYSVAPEPPASAPARLRSHWRQAVSAAAASPSSSIPVLTQTTITHRPAQKIGPLAPVQGTSNSVAAQSWNWSGNSIVDPTNPFQGEVVVGEFVVPTARQAFGTCIGGWAYSSLWPGIDGNGSNDVLQGGVEADAYCNGNTTASYYSAWVEWYPYAETRVSAPAMHPGDLVYVEVWSSSPTFGYVMFFNVSTQQSVTYGLTAPSGTSLVGNSVEWVVERPGVNGGLATLTNYIDASWPAGVAWNMSTGTTVVAGQDPPSGTLETLTMLDNAGNAISSAAIESINFLYFTNSGSAF